MIKIMDPTAVFVNGMVSMADGTRLFHIIHSKPLAILLGHGSSSIPIPLLFKQFPNPLTNSIPLFCSRTPKLSMVRLLLSSHPYALNSRLEVGYVQSNGVLVIHRDPIVKYMDFDEETIKPSSTLMVCTKEDLSDATPLTGDLQGRMAHISIRKQVVIDETQNQSFEFSVDDAVSTQVPPLITHRPVSILKKSAEHLQKEHISNTKHTQLFQAIKNHHVEIGNCPASSYNTILVMSRSHNSLNIAPGDTSLTLKQKLFIKHVILHNMGLENAVSDFEAIYDPHLQPVSDDDVDNFRTMVSDIKCKVEDAVFALNSICNNKFKQHFSPGSCRPETLLLLEKYFLMFSPKDKTNSINFGAGIIELIFNGTEFKKLISFIKKYMEVQTTTPEDNMFKIYALLTN